MREFTDEKGTRWMVYYVGTATHGVASSRLHLPDEFRNGWLCFDSGERKLRLGPVPTGWAELPEAGLRELLGRARPTEPARPSGTQRAFGAPPPDDRKLP
jgi:hypothetical protein